MEQALCMFCSVTCLKYCKKTTTISKIWSYPAPQDIANGSYPDYFLNTCSFCGPKLYHCKRRLLFIALQTAFAETSMNWQRLLQLCTALKKNWIVPLEESRYSTFSLTYSLKNSTLKLHGNQKLHLFVLINNRWEFPRKYSTQSHVPDDVTTW